ncbi:MAG: heat-inducible transcriptional repressor HrcA [Alphaproteobacteria bacterium]|nr:heat-inducible transcriptional repressor HrcA [Alphaproteobacteria bacterium]
MKDLSRRSLEIFTRVVQGYMRTGEPIGSDFLRTELNDRVSSATVRNVMSVLQDKGLLKALHVSSGRMPTEEGLRFFVNAVLQHDCLKEEEKRSIVKKCTAVGRDMNSIMRRASEVLSDLAQCAGIVVAPKHKRTIAHMEAIQLPDGNALMVIVGDKGYVENRIVKLPRDVDFSILKETVNIFNKHLSGYTLEEAISLMGQECVSQRQDVRVLVQDLIRDGLGSWFESACNTPILMTDEHHMMEESPDGRIEEVRDMLSSLKKKEVMKDLLNTVESGDGIQVFIGGENNLFTRSGCSLIISSVRCARGAVVGALGVVGPTRLDYARVIPLVEYTSKMVGLILDDCDGVEYEQKK